MPARRTIAQPSTPEPLPFGHYLGVAKRWWWLLVLGTIVPAVLSYRLASQQPQLYQAQATLMVGGSIWTANPNPNAVQISTMLAQSYAQLVKRQPVTRAVIDKLGLQTTPDVLAQQITARVQPQSQLLEIQVTDLNPQWAAVIANALANELIIQSPGARQTSEERSFNEKQLIDLRARIETVTQDLEAERARLAGLTSAAEIAEGEERIAALERVWILYQSAYSTLFQSVVSEQSPNTLTIVEEAGELGTPVPSKLPLVIGVAGLAGLGLAFGGVLLIEMMDDRLKWEGPGHSRALGLPVLGAVSRIRSADGPLVLQSRPSSREAECFRGLRTAILLTGGRNAPRILLCTSAAPQEGKSLVVANLGLAMAALGRRTLIVDGDLRKRQLHLLFNLPNGRGLTELLCNGDSADAYVQQTSVPNLSVLRAGGPAADPTSLLASQRFGDLLDELKQGYDTLLLDSPAALVVPDAAILASQSDGVLLLVDAQTTSRRAALRVRRAMEEQAGARVLGTVFNRVRLKRHQYYYH